MILVPNSDTQEDLTIQNINDIISIPYGIGRTSKNINKENHHN